MFFSTYKFEKKLLLISKYIESQNDEKTLFQKEKTETLTIDSPLKKEEDWKWMLCLNFSISIVHVSVSDISENNGKLEKL